MSGFTPLNISQKNVHKKWDMSYKDILYFFNPNKVFWNFLIWLISHFTNFYVDHYYVSIGMSGFTPVNISLKSEEETFIGFKKDDVDKS